MWNRESWYKWGMRETVRKVLEEEEKARKVVQEARENASKNVREAEDEASRITEDAKRRARERVEEITETARRQAREERGEKAGAGEGSRTRGSSRESGTVHRRPSTQEPVRG
jgi:vacuolar-type H+-ATPase subunit H